MESNQVIEQDHISMTKIHREDWIDNHRAIRIIELHEV
jgi:hypothetical protein